MSIELHIVRGIADKAQTASDAALDRLDPDADHEYADPALEQNAYAQGVEDVLRFLAGDIKCTEALALVLVAGDTTRVGEYWAPQG